MLTVRIADINIGLHNRYPYTKALCRDYMVPYAACDFEVHASEKDIAEEIKSAEIEVGADYAESVCLHREIAEQLWRFDCFLLHSALIECDGQGYAFAARSGVGKSTHIGLWKKNFDDRVRIINGDKPIVRISEEGILGYGTPWNGKERQGDNTWCSIRALCFLMRGEKNKIVSISADEAVSLIFPQIYLPKSGGGAAKTLDLLDAFVEKVSFFRLACNMQDEAAIIAHETMSL